MENCKPCANCQVQVDLEHEGHVLDPEKGLLCVDCGIWFYSQVKAGKHSPTPWVAEPEEAIERRGIAICSPSGDAIVAVIAGDDRRADEIDWANARLIVQAVNSHDDLVAAYAQVDKAFLDALHALNDAGLPCPASLGLAMDRLRQITAKAKGDGS